MSTHSSPPNKAQQQPSVGDTSGDQRLQKYLAHAGVASRRRAEELITSGVVTVNGRVVDELGTRVNAATDDVRVYGKPVHPATEFLYIMLNKPTGAVSTVTDPQGRRTVLDLLPDEWRQHRIYPVGRLDYDTEGLLLLTNDGDLALHLTHPRYALPKRYHALLAAEPPDSALRRLEEGLRLPGESRRTAPARVWVLQRQGDALWIAIEIHEGRNRQVRRMLEAVGYSPLRLRRVSVGPLGLGHLKVGDYRQLTAGEVTSLRAGAIQHLQPTRLAESEEPPEETGSNER